MKDINIAINILIITIAIVFFSMSVFQKQRNQTNYLWITSIQLCKYCTLFYFSFSVENKIYQLSAICRTIACRQSISGSYTMDKTVLRTFRDTIVDTKICRNLWQADNVWRCIVNSDSINRFRGEKKKKMLIARAAVGRGRFYDERFHPRRTVERSSCDWLIVQRSMWLTANTWNI